MTGESAGGDWTSLFVAVSLVMVLICVLAFVAIRWVFPRMIRSPLGRKNSALQIVGRYALEPRKSVYLLRVGRKHFVVGAGERELHALGELDTTDLPVFLRDQTTGDENE